MVFISVITIDGPKLTHVGDTLVIKCSATYIGVAGIDWFFQGYLLQSDTDDGIRITERFSSVSKTIHSTLEIEKADMRNSGTYTCRSADEYVKEYRVMVLSDGKTSIVLTFKINHTLFPDLGHNKITK